MIDCIWIGMPSVVSKLFISKLLIVVFPAGTIQNSNTWLSLKTNHLGNRSLKICSEYFDNVKWKDLERNHKKIHDKFPQDDPLTGPMFGLWKVYPSNVADIINSSKAKDFLKSNIRRVCCPSKDRGLNDFSRLW